MKCSITEWSRKIAQTLMHRHFATVCSRIARFLSKCSEKFIVYKLMQNLYKLVKYSLINSRNWIHVMSDVSLHVNITPLTVEVKRLTANKKLRRLKRLDCWKKTDSWASSETGEIAYAVWSLRNNWVYWAVVASLKGWVVLINVVRSKLSQISNRLITWTAAKTDNQVTNSYGGNVFG